MILSASTIASWVIDEKCSWPWKKQSVLSTERTSQSIKETKYDRQGRLWGKRCQQTTPRYSRREKSRFWTRKNLVAMCFAEWLGRECRWGFCCDIRRKRATIPRSSCWISHHHRLQPCHQQSQWKPLDYCYSPCHRAKKCFLPRNQSWKFDWWPGVKENIRLKTF